MGATNHTTNYNLPQFVGSDKPTWLGDVNGAMSAIDTQMKSNNTLAGTADTKADTALTNASTAQSTATTADAKADNANTTATNALNKSLSVEQALNEFKQVFNLTDGQLYNGNQMTTPDGSVLSSSNITIITNSDKSLFKIYGNLFVTTSTAGSHTVTIPNTGLDPESDYSIANASLEYYGAASNEIIANGIYVRANGNVEINYYTRGAVSNMRVILIPILYFNKSFGDTPTPPEN